MKIKALVPFLTGTISMEQNEVKDVEDTLGEQLISAGVAVEIGGGSGGGVLVVHDVDGTLDKTWQEIHDAGAAIISLSNNVQSKSWYIVTSVTSAARFIVSACLPSVNGKTGEPENDFRRYAVDSADGYPIHT